jgi:hypothetical protein
MKLLNRTVMAAVALSLCGPLHALDDQRQGFFVSVGAGYSTSEYIDNSFASASRQGLGTSFRIGGGFNNRTIGYYVRHVAWSAELENSLGFSGAGVAHYFSPTSKSAYINAAVGFGDSLDIDRLDDMGAGFMLGGGYQFSERMSWEANYYSFSDEYMADGEVNAFQLLFQMHWF